jgi:hypothetical protein
MSENYVDPINRSATGVTATEGVKGALRGGFTGLFTGPLYGLLGGATIAALPAAIFTGIIGGATALLGAPETGLSIFAYGTGLSALVGGTVGVFGGALAGGPVGAAVGGLRGIGRGRDIVNHERGASQMLATQQAVAQSQEATAAALMAQAQRPVIIQAPGAPMVAPGFTVTSPTHQGQGMSTPTRAAANDMAGSHTQRVEASREAAATAQGVGA